MRPFLLCPLHFSNITNPKQDPVVKNPQSQSLRTPVSLGSGMAGVAQVISKGWVFSSIPNKHGCQGWADQFPALSHTNWKSPFLLCLFCPAQKGKGHTFWNGQIRVRTLALPCTHCVTLGKPLNLSEPVSSSTKWQKQYHRTVSVVLRNQEDPDNNIW